MAQKLKGPRLFLKRRQGGTAMWFVRDGTRMFSTGFAEPELENANAALDGYCSGKGEPAHRSEPGFVTRPHTIYFISCDVPHFPVKIGTTSNVSVRLAAIGVSLPYETVLLATMPGDQDTEIGLHLSFAEHRLRGEWFERAPKLMAFIASITEASHAGSDVEHIKHAATHSDIAQTQRYSRGAAEKIAGVQKKRVEHRNKFRHNS